MGWGGCALAECAVCGEICERQGRASYCERCDPDAVITRVGGIDENRDCSDVYNMREDEGPARALRFYLHGG